MNTRTERAAAVAFEGLLYATLIASALLFGAVETWAEAVVATLVVAMGFCWVVGNVSRGPRVPGTRRLHWLVLAFVVLAAVQLVPVPAALMKVISPQTVHWHQASLDAMSESGAAHVSAVAISLTPSAGVAELRRLILIAAVFYMVSSTGWSRPTIERFLAVLALFGGALALFAIVQSVSGTDRLFWVRETGGGFFGPLANPNNYCAYLNLCAGAALASLLIRLDRNRRQGTPSWSSVGTIVHVAALALIAVSVLASLSRGGIVTMIVGVGLAGTLLASRGRTESQFKWLLVVGVAAAAGIAWLGWSPVESELETLDRELQVHGGRMTIWRDSIPAMTDHWLLGTGLGSFEQVFRVYRSFPSGSRHTHAESNLVQLGVETGGVGLLLVLGLMQTVSSAWRRAWRRHRSSTTAFMLIGLAYALATNVMHAAVDVGMLVLSNALLFAVVCAIVPALQNARSGDRNDSHTATDRDAPQAEKLRTRRRGIRAAVFGLIIAIAAGLASSYARTLRSERDWAQADRLLAAGDEPDGTLSDERAERVIDHVRQCVVTSPHDFTIRYELASLLWTRLREHDTAPASPPVSGESERASPEALEAIASHLRQVCRECPVFGYAHMTLAAVYQEMGRHEPAMKLARHAIALFPTDGWQLFVAAQLALDQNQVEAARSWFRQALAAHAPYLEDVLSIAVSDPRLSELLVAVVPASDGMLLSRSAELIGSLAEQEEDAAVMQQRDALLQAAITVLEKDPRLVSDSRLRFALARNYAAAGDLTASADQFRKGLARSPGDSRHRLRYAEVLLRLGQPDTAKDQLERVLRSHPGHGTAKRLLRTLIESAYAESKPKPEGS